MTPTFLLLFIVLRITAENVNKTTCDGFQANFDIKSVIGSWNSVMVFPGEDFIDIANIKSYKVEFSETDESALRWLVNNTLESEVATNTVGRIKGTIIRQRYFTENPFDVWSRAIEGVHGCFQQVLALDMDKSDFSKGLTNDAVMQLHLIDAPGTTGPILVQLLWGRVISAVVYRKEGSMAPGDVDPTLLFLAQVRGTQHPPTFTVENL